MCSRTVNLEDILSAVLCEFTRPLPGQVGNEGTVQNRTPAYLERCDVKNGVSFFFSTGR